MIKSGLYYYIRFACLISAICVMSLLFGNGYVMLPSKLDFLFRVNAPYLLEDKNLQTLFNNNKDNIDLKSVLLPDGISASSIKQVYIFGTHDEQFNIGALVFLDSKAENKFWEFYKKEFQNNSAKKIGISDSATCQITVGKDDKLGDIIRVDGTNLSEPIIFCRNTGSSLLIGTKSWVDYCFKSPKKSLEQINKLFLPPYTAHEIISGKVFNRNISRHRNGKPKDDWLETTIFVKSASINNDVSVDVTILCNSERYPVQARSRILLFYQFALMPFAESNNDLCVALQQALKSQVKQRSLYLNLELKRSVIKQFFDLAQTMSIDDFINTVQLLGSM